MITNPIQLLPATNFLPNPSAVPNNQTRSDFRAVEETFINSSNNSLNAEVESNALNIKLKKQFVFIVQVNVL